jgi:hypothetical protein
MHNCDTLLSIVTYNKERYEIRGRALQSVTLCIKKCKILDKVFPRTFYFGDTRHSQRRQHLFQECHL